MNERVKNIHKLENCWIPPNKWKISKIYGYMSKKSSKMFKISRVPLSKWFSGSVVERRGVMVTPSWKTIEVCYCFIELKNVKFKLFLNNFKIGSEWLNLSLQLNWNLDKAQEKASRNITGSNVYDSTTFWSKQLKILKLSD